MSKLWDIAQFVEANPDDHEQRWRLCKKLYAAKEYRLALEHLHVLKNHWEDRKRVRRYLAATHYRMEYYQDAIKELEEAIAIWPEEVDLREQLAQAYYKAGDLDACSEVWAKISEINPKHKYAAQAAQAIKAQARGEQQDQFDTDALGNELDQGFGMSVEVTCPQCNAKNSDEFERCWNCHAPLEKDPSAPRPYPASAPSPYGPLHIDDDPDIVRGNLIWGLLAGAGAVALLCLYLTITLFMTPAPTGPAMTLEELLQHHTVGSRIWLGAIVLVVWTFLLAISADIFFKEKPSQIPECLCVGFIAGGIAYTLSWLPLEQLATAFLVPAAVSLALMFVVLPKKIPKVLGAWALHLVLVFAFMYAGTMIVERSNTGIWINPVQEYSNLLAYAQKRATEQNPGVYALLDGPTPQEKKFKLEPTGSAWVDARAKAITFHVQHEPGAEQLRFEIYDENRTRVFELLSRPEWSGLYFLETGKTFTVNVYGPEKTPVKVEISSLLFPNF